MWSKFDKKRLSVVELGRQPIDAATPRRKGEIMPRSKAPGTHRTAAVQTTFIPRDKERVKAMAIAHGMEVSELVRNILLAEVEKWERKQERKGRTR